MTGAHILVIDDEPAVTMVIERAALGWGYHITAARSLEQGRQILEASPDIVLLLLDIKLPDGSGLDFLESLRRDPATSSLPVIILTGAGYDDPMARAESLGAQYVMKPFSPSKLGKLIGTIVDQAHWDA